MTLLSPRPLIGLSLLLLAAGAVQGTTLFYSLDVLGHPDLVFTITIVAALLSDAPTGSLIGLCGGLLTASLAGDTVGTFLVSRIVPGFLAGWVAARLFRANSVVIMLGVLGATLLAEMLYLLAAPGIGSRLSLGSTLIGAVINAFLSVPVMLLLQRLGWQRGER